MKGNPWRLVGEAQAMMLPLATDVRMRSLPYANSFLVALTVIAYLAIGPAHAYEHHPFILTYWSPSGILGHIFMHGDFWHLAGNMLFLWVFGNAVCSRIGNLWYPLLYLGLGVVTAMLAMPEPGSGAVGASAAINGIIGLFIILFPLSRIKMLITMLYAWGDILWLPSVFMVGLWFAFDVYGLATGAGRVGYGAHIAGLLSGVGLGIILVRCGWVRWYKGELSLLHILGLAVPPPRRERPRETHRPALPAPERTAMPWTLKSNFKAWPAPARGKRVRCACGTVLAPEPHEAGTYIRCPRCGGHVYVPGPRVVAASRPVRT